MINHDHKANTGQRVLKAAAYLRVSTPGQVKGDSLDQQEKQVIEYIKAQGWQLEKIVIDAGISGAMAGRDGFQTMIADAKSGKYDRIVAYRVDRFIRHGGNRFGVLMDEMRQQGVFFCDLTGFISEDREGSFQYIMDMLRVHLAAHDVGNIKAKTWKQKQVLRKDGRLYEGPAPYGYKYVRYCRHDLDIWSCESCRGNNKNVIRGEFIKDPDQEAIYLRIVSRYLDKNMSLKAIAAELRAEGLPMSEPNLSRILKAEIYTGKHYANKNKYEQRKDENGEPYGPSIKLKELKPRSEWIEYPAPAMIDKAKWDRIQNRRKRNRVKTKRDGKVKSYWLRDALACGACLRMGHKSAAIKTKTIHANGKANRYYRCHWRDASRNTLKQYKRERCQLKLIRADDLEAAIWKSIRRVMLVGENIDIFADATKWDRHLQDQTAELETTIKAADRALTGLKRRKHNVDRILDRDLTADQLDRFLADEQDLDQQIRTQEAIKADAAAQIAAIKADHKQQKDIMGYMAENPKTLKELDRRLEDLSHDDKKNLVDAMIDTPIIIESNPAGEWRITNESKPKRVPVQILRELGSDGKLTFTAGQQRKLIEFYEHIAMAA